MDQLDIYIAFLTEWNSHVLLELIEYKNSTRGAIGMAEIRIVLLDPFEPELVKAGGGKWSRSKVID